LHKAFVPGSIDRVLSTAERPTASTVPRCTCTGKPSRNGAGAETRDGKTQIDTAGRACNSADDPVAAAGFLAIGEITDQVQCAALAAAAYSIGRL